MKTILKSLLLALVAATFSSCAFDGSYSSSYGGRQSAYTPSYGPSYASPHDIYVVENTGHVTSYGSGRNTTILPPTGPMVFTNTQIQDSYREKVYDNWGYLKRGVYYQTHPKRASTVHDHQLAQAMWAD